MFGTRLNPTKPAAGQRAALERAGIACKELRTAQEPPDGLPLSSERISGVFAKHGLFRIGIAAEYGGVGTDPLLTVLAAERLGREAFRYVNLFLLQHAIAANTITRWATDQQKERLLRQAASSHHSISFSAEALREVDTDVDLRFETSGDGLVVNGRARAVPCGCNGGTLVLVGKGEASCTAVLVDIGQQGVQARSRADDTVGGLAVWDFEFTHCVMDEASVLSRIGDGPAILSAARSDARLGVAAGCVGALEESLETIAAIALDRLRDGEWSGVRQAIERYLAGLATDLEASRGLVYAAAELKADFDRRPTSAHLASESSTLIREANYFATQSIYRLQSSARSIEVRNGTLLDFLPNRFLKSGSNDLFAEPGDQLERGIAAYYLDV